MKSFAITVGCFLVMGGAIIVWPYRFYSDSICSRCGASKRSTEWQFPHSQAAFFTHSTVAQTPLSSYLTTAGIAGPHAHRWLFGHGGGNGVRCALGDGDHLRSAVWSTTVPRLLASSRLYGDSEQAAKLVNFTFDPELSRAVLSLATMMPTNDFASKAAYDAWMSEQALWFDSMVEAAEQRR